MTTRLVGEVTACKDALEELIDDQLQREGVRQQLGQPLLDARPFGRGEALEGGVQDLPLAARRYFSSLFCIYFYMI